MFIYATKNNIFESGEKLNKKTSNVKLHKHLVQNFGFRVFSREGVCFMRLLSTTVSVVHSLSYGKTHSVTVNR